MTTQNNRAALRMIADHLVLRGTLKSDAIELFIEKCQRLRVRAMEDLLLVDMLAQQANDDIEKD